MQNAVLAGSQQINKEIEDRCRLPVAVPDIGLMRMHNMHTDMVHMDAHASYCAPSRRLWVRVLRARADAVFRLRLLC